MSFEIDWDLVADRISREVRKLGLTQKAVGKLIGISQSSVSSYQKGTSRKRPSVDSLATMATVFNVTVDYLLGLTDDPAGRDHLLLDLPGAQPGEYELVPFVREPIAAGSPSFLPDEVGSSYALRTSWRKRHAKGAVRFMQVKHGWHGESMAPTILPGAVLIVDLGDHDVQAHQGGVFVVRLPGEEGGVTCKRCYLTDGQLICTSDNHSRMPFTVSLRDRPRDQVVLGRVLRWEQGEDER